MARLGLIEEDIVLPEKDGFILCDENGVGRVTLLSVIGKGGTAIALIDPAFSEFGGCPFGKSRYDNSGRPFFRAG